MNPLTFSIVTPSYNQGKFLEQTMRSVFAQDYPDVEYFVMDGGSSDQSLNLIQEEASRLTGWASEPDRGQADAINKGFRNAKGDIFAWINSDDFFLPNAFSAVSKFFAEHPEIDLLYGDVLSVDGEGKLINVMRFSPYSLTDLLTFHIISQPGVFFRREAWERAGGLDLNDHYLLDHHLWLKMAKKSRIAYLSIPLAAARFHADAKNRAHAAEFGAEAHRIAKGLLNDTAWREETAGLERAIRGGAAWLDANYLSNAFEPGKALRAYLRAGVLSPVRVARDWRRVLLTLLMAVDQRKAQAVFESQAQKRLAKLTTYQELLDRA